MKTYWSDPEHATWTSHYYDGRWGGRLLCFSPAWRDANLPPEMSQTNYDGNAFTVYLLDTQDGKEYETHLPAAYELADYPDNALTLQDYLYGSHHCQCHRKCDAKDQGADTDEICDGERFVIARIESPTLPGLILYSETLTETELEASLEKLPRPRQPAEGRTR